MIVPDLPLGSQQRAARTRRRPLPSRPRPPRRGLPRGARARARDARRQRHRRRDLPARRDATPRAPRAPRADAVRRLRALPAARLQAARRRSAAPRPCSRGSRSSMRFAAIAPLAARLRVADAPVRRRALPCLGRARARATLRSAPRSRRSSPAWTRAHARGRARTSRSSQIPVLIAWAPEDRFFKLANAERMAARDPERAPGADRGQLHVRLDRPAGAHRRADRGVRARARRGCLSGPAARPAAQEAAPAGRCMPCTAAP